MVFLSDSANEHAPKNLGSKMNCKDNARINLVLIEH